MGVGSACVDICQSSLTYFFVVFFHFCLILNKPCILCNDLFYQLRASAALTPLAKCSVCFEYCICHYLLIFELVIFKCVSVVYCSLSSESH